MYTRSDLYFIAHKALTTLAYLALAFLTWRFFRGRLDVAFALGCTALSACWCLLTRIKMAHFMQTYFDVFSRLEVIVPSSLGVGLCVTSILTHARMVTHMVNGAVLLCWLAIVVLYQKNKKKYEKDGYGPLPKGTWLSPPIDMMQAGDLILTSGQVAADLHESVGHAATVIEQADGLYAISSHMDRGCTVEPIANVVGEIKGLYILLKLTQPIDEEKKELLTRLANEMVQQNSQWKKRRQEAWSRFVDNLPLSATAKEKIARLYKCTGYDWAGTLMGRVEKDRWTCIGAAVELYKRANIHTNPYGTGLLGFGTTLFDPIMPVRFLNDPAFRLLTKEPQELPEGQPLLFHD